jgi:hypothetical protein
MDLNSQIEAFLAAYAEAPMSPLTMVRRMLQDAVGDDFADFLAG